MPRLEQVASIPEEASRERTAYRRARRLMMALSVLLCVGLSLCYAQRPDSCAAVTVWPVWAWLAPGLMLTTPGWNRHGRRGSAIMAALWLIFLFAFAEEPHSLMRFGSWPTEEWQAARRRGAALRVISLNCAGGDPKAAEEVAPYRPDIVLLQESPSRRDVEELAQRLFGAKANAICGPDASLIARGKVTPAILPASLRVFFVQARVRIDNGQEISVVSLRLTPPVFRLDLWSPDCWRAQTENRGIRREQLQTLIPYLQAVPKSIPLIVGGDFNAPAGDAVFRLLPPRLRDTFRDGGRGWGNTIINDFPALRIDQVWADERFRAVAVAARKTRYSDHRMVICDILTR